MDLDEAFCAPAPLSQLSSEQMPVRLESFPVWKQLLVESRQEQTVAELAMAESKRQIASAKQQVVLLELLRRRLQESYLWHCNDATHSG